MCLPIFRIVRERGRDGLRVVGVLAVDTRLPGAFLKTDVQRAVRDYASVIQDVIEPVHGSSVRDIVAGGAAPIETILVNGQDPKVPPIERAMTFSVGPAPAARR
jgi:hypothetical protein